MSFLDRPASLDEVSEQILRGDNAGYVVKDFLHEFQARRAWEMLAQQPRTLSGSVKDGEMLDAFLQALAVYLSVKLGRQSPKWTQPPIQLANPWFASPGEAIRNYLLISSPAPFRARNLFVDEDSLTVV